MISGMFAGFFLLDLFSACCIVDVTNYYGLANEMVCELWMYISTISLFAFFILCKIAAQCL